MSYDHGDNAGNEGDIVKHVALYAALDTILSGFGGSRFCFADLYAGYATNILAPRGAWKRGIQIVRDALVNAANVAPVNKHVSAWADCYVGNPVGAGDCYPGSTLIARDLVLRHLKQLRLAAWDISPGPLGNLRAMFGSGESPTSPSRIYAAPASPADADVLAADFLLLDPPGVKEFWRACFEQLPAMQKNFLVWLPIMTGRNWTDSEENRRAHAEALRLGLASSRVVWGERRQGMIGCELIYPFGAGPVRAALRDAVDEVVRLAGWSATLKTVSGDESVIIGPSPPIFHTV